MGPSSQWPSPRTATCTLLAKVLPPSLHQHDGVCVHLKDPPPSLCVCVCVHLKEPPPSLCVCVCVPISKTTPSLCVCVCPSISKTPPPPPVCVHLTEPPLCVCVCVCVCPSQRRPPPPPPPSVCVHLTEPPPLCFSLCSFHLKDTDIGFPACLCVQWLAGTDLTFDLQ